MRLFFRYIIIFLISVFAFLPAGVFADSIESDGAPLPAEITYTKGKVAKAYEPQTIAEFGQEYIEQYVDVEFYRNGEMQIQTFSYEYEPYHQERILKKGDRVIIGSQEFGSETQYFISDVYRIPAMAIVFAIFIGITFFVVGKRTIQAVGGLVISFVVIAYYLVPALLAGGNPFVTSLIAALGISIVSLFFAHGWNRRTMVAFIATMATVLCSLVLSQFFVWVTKLTGLGTEEAFLLQSSSEKIIQMKGLLLGGMIIGILGVLDDVTTAQAALVEQFHDVKKHLSVKELYMRGIAVGKEHIISLVNTLVLAYASASLPLFLLFQIYDAPVWVTLNSEIISEEVVRMIAGSSALVIAVPITTAIAAIVYGKGYLSKMKTDMGHHHSH